MKTGHKMTGVEVVNAKNHINRIEYDIQALLIQMAKVDGGMECYVALSDMLTRLHKVKAFVLENRDGKAPTWQKMVEEFDA